MQTNENPDVAFTWYRERARRYIAVAIVILVVLAGCTTVTDIPSIGDSEDSNTPIFQNATTESGLDYRGVGTGSGAGNSGVYVSDVNNDDWQDLLILGGEQPALFHNTGGEFERADSFPAINSSLKSATLLDYDSDGWEDIILFTIEGEPVTLHNNKGVFERANVGLGNLTYPLGGAVADFDRDGDEDLLVYQSGQWSDRKPAGYNRPVSEDNGNSNILFENTGGNFERVNSSGINGDHWSLAASFADLNGDKYPDIHVANDYNNDIVYINKANKTFKKQVLENSTARNGMSSEIADVNGDGRLDIFVTNIYLPLEENKDKMSKGRYDRIERHFEHVIHSDRTKGNTLLINQGNGNFTDKADEYGIRKGGWGWAASLTDIDNDGAQDLVHATQKVVRLDPNEPRWTLPMVWERDMNSFTPLNQSAHGIGELNSRGMATLDYDRDGDQDIVFSTYDDPTVLYENTDQNGNALQVEVVDKNGNTALGSTVTVEGTANETVFYQSNKNDFLSRDSPTHHIGIGDTEEITLQVTWQNGTERNLNVSANQRIRVSPNDTENITSFSRN